MSFYVVLDYQTKWHAFQMIISLKTFRRGSRIATAYLNIAATIFYLRSFFLWLENLHRR